MRTAFGAVAGGATKPPAGLLLAAGAGRRMGTPKALVDGWLAHGIDALAGAGCSRVVVVLGAGLEQARALVHGRAVTVVAAANWSDGLSASLRAGILALPADAPAAVVTLVDLPDVGESVVRRVLEKGAGPATLTRATYHGRPGHPVVLGRAHWRGILAAAKGDVGARAYFDRHAPALVECADLASGQDIDWADETGSRAAVVRRSERRRHASEASNQTPSSASDDERGGPKSAIHATRSVAIQHVSSGGVVCAR